MIEYVYMRVCVCVRACVGACGYGVLYHSILCCVVLWCYDVLCYGVGVALHFVV